MSVLSVRVLKRTGMAAGGQGEGDSWEDRVPRAGPGKLDSAATIGGRCLEHA